MGLGDELSDGIEGKAGTIEDETVIASDLIDEQDGKMVLAGDAGEHGLAELTLADMERRGRNVEDELGAGTDEILDWDRSHKDGGSKRLCHSRRLRRW